MGIWWRSITTFVRERSKQSYRETGRTVASALIARIKAALLQGTLRELDSAVVLASAVAGKGDGENHDDVISANGRR